MTPFESWFSTDFRKALLDVPDDRTVLTTGFSIRSASWDRRAAYLLWQSLGQPAPSFPSLTNPDPKESFLQRPYPPSPPIEADPLLDLLG